MQKKGNQKIVSVLQNYTLTNNEEISPGVHVISFLRDFDFNPGQVLKIAIDINHAPRIYSICSGNNEREVRRIDGART